MVFKIIHVAYYPLLLQLLLVFLLLLIIITIISIGVGGGDGGISKGSQPVYRKGGILE